MKCKVKCEYLKIRKLRHNDGIETTTCECNKRNTIKEHDFNRRVI